jgi:hypothetical protein
MPAVPPAPNRASRAPPSSQPILPTRHKSAFPSLQRPHPHPLHRLTQPQAPSFMTRPQSTPWRSSLQAPAGQSQSQRPTTNRLDHRYSPPSSQPSQLFHSQSQAQPQSQIRRQARPSSSQSQTQTHSQVGLGPGIVDQYRPDPIPVSRSAIELYRSTAPPAPTPPKAQKAVEILEKLSSKLNLPRWRYS